MTQVITFTDYPTLQCGHPSSSKTEISIVGLELRVFGLDEIRESKLPVAVVVSMCYRIPRDLCYPILVSAIQLTVQIAAHGRLNKKEQMEPFAHGLLGAVRDRYNEGARRRDVIVVTLVSLLISLTPTSQGIPPMDSSDDQDQMNHGSRLRHPTHNLAYDKNEQHLTDMAAQVGECTY